MNGWLAELSGRHGRVIVAYDHGSLKPWVVELGTDGRSISLGRTFCEAVRVARIPRVDRHHRPTARSRAPAAASTADSTTTKRSASTPKASRRANSRDDTASRTPRSAPPSCAPVGAMPPTREPRRCVRCGCILARDQRSRFCTPCQISADDAFTARLASFVRAGCSISKAERLARETGPASEAPLDFRQPERHNRKPRLTD